MHEILSGSLDVLLYFLIVVAIVFGIRKFTKIPDEPFRKLLHFILLGSLLVWTFAFDKWWMAALTSMLFAVLVFPILKLAEKINGFSKFVTERKSGELKYSLLVVFIMYATIVSVCWGIFDDRLLALCSIYAWGIGDAAAALIGKRFGRHGLSGKHIEGRKSVEGTLAMFCCSFISVLAILLLRGSLPWYAYPVISLFTAAVSAAVELFTKSGFDTITCPMAAMAVILCTIHLFGGIAV